MRPGQTLSLHTLAGKFPHLLGAEFDELVADIKTHGLHEPITRFEGQILDGWNRYRACLRLKIEPRFEEFEGDAAAALAFARSKNIVRRHLTAKAKRNAIATLLKANPDQSNSAIAKIAKVNDKTVGAVRANLERRSEIPNVTTRKDTKGRQQPARKASKAKPAAPPMRDSDNAPDPETAAEKRKQEFAAMETAGESTATNTTLADFSRHGIPKSLFL
jgi:hypothetical protein